MAEQEPIENVLSVAECNLLAAANELNDGRDMLPWIKVSDPQSWKQFRDALKSLNHRWVVARAIIELDFERIKDALD